MNTRPAAVASTLLVIAAWSPAGLAGRQPPRPAGQTVEAAADGLRSPQWQLRDQAVQTLGTIKSKEAIDLLVAALADDHGAVRRSARQALAGLGGLAVVETTGALDSPLPEVRRQAAWILGSIEDTRVVAPLLGGLNDREAAVRLESSAGLARAGSGPNADLVVHGVMRVLADPNAPGRLDAAWTLGQVKAQRSVAALAATLADPGVGWMAATSLGVIGAPAAAVPLAAALASPSVMTRRGAAWALARTGAPAAVPVLQRALFDADEEVRHWAAEALRRTGTAAAVRALSAGKATRWDREARRCSPARSTATVSGGVLRFGTRSHQLYPGTLDRRPDIPSPLTTANGAELSVALTGDGRYAIYPVTLAAADRQCHADADDFPTLARTGLHAEIELDRARTITGRSVTEITELARPGRLSDAGFLGASEDIVSVLRADNRTVALLGLAHPDLARPLLHIWNMMQIDLKSGRWNHAEQRWQHVVSVFSHGQTVTLTAGEAGRRQPSVFADGIEGAFWIDIRRDLSGSERDFLRRHYPGLSPNQMDGFIRALTSMRTGEMQSHYIMWYGFYEGLTPWRADPIAIALVFGLRTLEEVEAAFPGRLYNLMMARDSPQPRT